MKIEGKNLCVNFGDTQALKHISLSLDEGIYGLIGPNGSGKSTLIHVLTTLLTPTSGDVLVDGKKVSARSNEFQNTIGLMPQSMKGYHDFTAIRFLYYMAALKGYKKQEAEKEIHTLVEKVRLKNDMHKKIKAYSGGMRQRLMFCQALLGNPKFLLLDEPTAGLDPYERINMRNFIAEQANNRIVLIATHVMQDIEAIAQNIILLNNGKIQVMDRPEHLIEQLKGKIYESCIPEEALAQYQKKYKISNITKLKDQVFIRYINDTQPMHTSDIIPTLEEVYLYYLVEQ